MAKNISQTVEEEYRFPNFIFLHLKIKFRKFIKIYRNFIKSIISVRKKDEYPLARINGSLESSSADFKNNHWAFIEEFWGKEFHDYLIKEWPHSSYFEPIKHITKSYDQGFHWRYGQDFSQDIKRHEILRLAFEYIRSEEFSNRVTDFAGDGVKRICTQILLTNAYSGSSVIPHIDSDNDKYGINIVMFINGTGGANAGGLGIWNDNEFKSKIFEPTNLINSCILYDMSESFYHGFKPMKHGAFRWTINTKFSNLT